ncbi:MAG TPA: MFS transporter [Jatrophihabitans sp.]|jgi:MFS family permease|uniref:MFS transporter n=1 Tax=Jatrophihabitans sp. TaxID=1932789 RepID=UPI002F19250B
MPEVVDHSLPVAPRQAPTLWRDKRTLGWALGLGFSEFGDEIWFVALAYTAAQLGSPGLAGLVLAAATVPRAVLMLLGGALTDRFDARRLMIGADIGRVLVLVGALAMLAAGGVSVGLLLIVGFLFGVADALYGPAASAFPRQLVVKSELGRLSGLRQLLVRFAAIFGAPVGGVLVAAYGISGAMVADALSFLVILVVCVLVRPRWPRARATGHSVLSDMRDGLRYLRTTPRVRDLVVTLSGLNVFVSPVVAVGLALRVSERGWGPAALGLLSGAIGVGAAVGTLTGMRWRPAYPVRTALGLLIVQAAGLALLGLLPFGLTLGTVFAIGVTAGLASPMLVGPFQATVDEEYLGRTSAVLGISDNGLMPIAMIGFGALVQVAGLAASTVAFGCAFALLLGLSLSRPHMRAMRADGSGTDDV